MPLPAILPLLGGLMTGVGTLGTAIGGIGRGRRENTQNRRNMKYMYDLDKDMFDYQNEYNTPKKQMQRLHEAGLNPALMYGQGTTGNASGYPQTKGLPAYQETPTDFAPIMQSILQLAQVGKTKTETEGLDIQNELELYSLPFSKRKRIAETQQAEKTVQLIQSNIGNVDADTENKVQLKLETIEKKEILKLEKAIKKVEKQRSAKGIIKGDYIGNVLSLMNLNPNNETDALIIKGFMYTFMGAKTAGAVMDAFPWGKIIKAITGKFGKNINTNNNYPNSNGYDINLPNPTIKH
jgi:hypothetical protein